MDKNTVYKKLLCFGLFPERLDGIFTSEEFGNWIMKNELIINTSDKKWTSLLVYRLTRNNNAPRQLGIPYPFSYLRLAREVKNSWNRIIKLFQKKYYIEKSMVQPKLDNKNHRLVSLANYDKSPELEQLQLDKQFGNKYLVYADVSTCYPSIYTHSLGWALVGKTEAKKHSTNTSENNKLWYNRIDKACQIIQDGETRGLPIGTDTSVILSEIILSKVDQKLKKYNYVRFIDDFRCSCKTKEEAEEFIRDLSRALDDFRLTVNSKKTKIFEYPQAINEDWVRKLRMAIDWQLIGHKEKDRVVGFLDLASDLFEKNPSESTIRYATQVLKNKKFENYLVYKLVLRYFLNLSFLFPYILDTCDDLISNGIKWFSSKKIEIKSTLADAVSEILKEHTKHRRSDAITWALFLSIKYEVSIPHFSKIKKDLLKTNDAVSILMSYLYEKIRGENISDYIKVLSIINPTEWWLFVYEVSRIENIKLLDENMERLRVEKISFLSKTITSKI